MSRTVCVYPQVGAFVEAENAFLGPNREWQWKPGDKKQEDFARRLESCRGEVSRIPELSGIASRSHEVINQFLASKKFDIRLDPFPPANSEAKPWGAASVLDVMVEWITEGTQRPIWSDDRSARFEGVELKDGVRIFVTPGREEPIVRVTTKSGDVVYMSMCDSGEPNMDTLLDTVGEWSRNLVPHYGYRGVVFPMIDLDERPDISWLVGLRTYDNEGFLNEVTQALQQTKFKMNEKGARVKSAVAIGGMRTTSMPMPEPPPYVINKRFMLWVVREGLTMPLFVADLTEENFKNPGSLENM